MTVKRSLYIMACIVFLTSFVPPVLTITIPRGDPAVISIGEATDLLTPFLVIGAILSLLGGIYRTRLNEELCYPDVLPLGLTVFFAILMTSGHGIHLSANALSHFLSEWSYGDIYQLNYLYDEVLSHYMWHVGAFGLSASVALYYLKYPLRDTPASIVSLLPPSVLQALTFTFATIEGETMPAIMPFTLIGLVGFVTVIKRHGLSIQRRPVLLFFILCCILMLLGWFAYGIVFGGYTSPTELTYSH